MKKKPNRKRVNIAPKISSKQKYVTGWPREHYNIDRTPKMQYKTEQSASGVARHMMKKTGAPELEVYKCSICGCWHIGHPKLIPTEERQLVLKKLIKGELAMLNYYKGDLEHIAHEVLALQTKMEHLEEAIQQNYKELYSQTQKPKNND